MARPLDPARSRLDPDFPRRAKLAAFGALALGIALGALALASSRTAPPPGLSLPAASALAASIALERWGMRMPFELRDAPGIKTARARAVDGRCLIERDGDVASARWARPLRERAGLYVDLHELAHCHEQTTPGFSRRKASASAADFARSREVYADAMAFSALNPQSAGFLPAFSRIPRSTQDPHDSGYAAACLLSQLSSSASDADKASVCADRAAEGSPPQGSPPKL